MPIYFKILFLPSLVKALSVVGYSSEVTSIQYKLGERFQDIWISPKTGKIPNPTIIKGETDVQIHNKIEKAMSSEGRYHIGINYNDKTGHIITAERIGDSILYYDAQSGKIISIASCEDIEYIELLKVDKLLFRKD